MTAISTDADREAEPTCPFKPGDRVRVKRGKASAAMRLTRGVVTRVVWKGSGHAAVHISRDGASPHDRYCFLWWPGDPSWGRWELAPVCDLSLDDTAVALARAVLAGDVSAALPLADRVAALVSGGE